MAVGLLDLPEELLIEVASALDRFALLALSQVCRALLYLSLSSSWYWHSDYVPAFLPIIAPINHITAAQFREAAIRSWRTRRILMGLGSSSNDSNLNQYNVRRRTTTINQPHRGYHRPYQTIGSRFLCEIEQGRAIFWDAWTGRRILPSESKGKPRLSPNSSLPPDKSPFANEERFLREPREETAWCVMLTSICVSTDRMRVGIAWSVIRPDSNSYALVLERLTVTFKETDPPGTARARDISAMDVDGGDGSGGECEDESRIIVEFLWEAPIVVYQGPQYDISRLCRMNDQYVAFYLRFDEDKSSYVRIYRWDDPFRRSYIYQEVHTRPLLEFICTPDHVVFVEGPNKVKGRNATQSIYIRPFPIRAWFPNSHSLSPFTEGVTEAIGEGHEMDWLEEGCRFPSSAGRLVIPDIFKQEYKENKIELDRTHTTQYYAVGGAGTGTGTGTAKLNSSIFTIIIGSVSTTVEPEETTAHYIISIPPGNEERRTEKKAGAENGSDDGVGMEVRTTAAGFVDAPYAEQRHIRVLNCGYHDPNLSALSIQGTMEQKEVQKEPVIGIRQIPYVSSHHFAFHNHNLHSPRNSHELIGAIIQHVHESKEIRKRQDFLISKNRSISYNERAFDAETGITLASHNLGIKEIIWYK